MKNWRDYKEVSMDIRSCYACGTPIPELRMKDKEYSFYCRKCTCATKWKEDLFEVQSDWNEGHVTPENGKTFWNLIKPW